MALAYQGQEAWVQVAGGRSDIHGVQDVHQVTSVINLNLRTWRKQNTRDECQSH